MKYLVTGGTGFVGSHLVRSLLDNNHEVVVLTRSWNHVSNSPNLTYITELPRSLEAFDHVIYLAGILGGYGTRTEMEQVHIALPAQLAERTHARQSFLYMSTAYVDTPFRVHKEYIETKVIGEKAVLSIRGFENTTYLRPGFVYGPGDLHHFPIYKWLQKLGAFFPIQGFRSPFICPTFVGDVVKTIMAASDTEGIVYVAGPPIKVNDWLDAIADALGTQRPVIRLPIPLIKRGFLATERVFQNDVPLQRDLSEGIEEAVEWYKAEGMLA